MERIVRNSLRLVIFLEDRFTRGFFAGVVGALAMSVVSYTSFYLFHFTEMRLFDYAAVIIYGHKVSVLWEAIFAQLAQFVFAGIMGVLFAYLITKLTSKNYLLKGWIFGISVWFFLFAIGTLYRLPHLFRIAPESAFTNFIASSFYGLVLAQTLHWLDNRIKSK